MSCCDASAVKITNQSGTIISVTGISTGYGTFRNISVGNTANNNVTLTGNAYSAGGTDGKASGSVTIKVGSSSVSFTLPYNFTPSNVFGKCPCSSSVSNATLSSGNYKATASTIQGSSDGGASVTWTIASQLAG
jgi:hypothetical protein